VRALVQRVSRSAVCVEGHPPVEIGRGMTLLLGVGRGDGPDELRFVAEKCAHLRIFEDDQGKMNRSILEVGGEALVISQFTLYADTRRGRRPSFVDAAPPEAAEAIYLAFVKALQDLGVPVKTGFFGARMQVEIHNDGPVSILVERP